MNYLVCFRENEKRYYLHGHDDDFEHLSQLIQYYGRPGSQELVLRLRLHHDDEYLVDRTKGREKGKGKKKRESVLRRRSQQSANSGDSRKRLSSTSDNLPPHFARTQQSKASEEVDEAEEMEKERMEQVAAEEEERKRLETIAAIEKGERPGIITDEERWALNRARAAAGSKKNALLMGTSERRRKGGKQRRRMNKRIESQESDWIKNDPSIRNQKSGKKAMAKMRKKQLKEQKRREREAAAKGGAGDPEEDGPQFMKAADLAALRSKQYTAQMKREIAERNSKRFEQAKMRARRMSVDTKSGSAMDELLKDETGFHGGRKSLDRVQQALHLNQVDEKMDRHVRYGMGRVMKGAMQQQQQQIKREREAVGIVDVTEGMTAAEKTQHRWKEEQKLLNSRSFMNGLIDMNMGPEQRGKKVTVGAKSKKSPYGNVGVGGTTAKRQPAYFKRTQKSKALSTPAPPKKPARVPDPDPTITRDLCPAAYEPRPSSFLVDAKYGSVNVRVGRPAREPDSEGEEDGVGRLSFSEKLKLHKSHITGSVK